MIRDCRSSGPNWFDGLGIRETVWGVDTAEALEQLRAASLATASLDAGAGEAALIEEAADYRVHPVDHGNITVELPEYTFQGAWTSDHAIATERDALVKALAAYAKLYRFVQSPQGKAPFLTARRPVFPNASEIDHEAQWNYIQRYQPFAVDLTLSAERLRYMQPVNVSFGVQSTILPFSRVADMSLAADALELLDRKSA